MSATMSATMSGALASCTDAVASGSETLRDAPHLTLRARLGAAHRIAHRIVHRIVQRRELPGGVRATTKLGQVAGGSGDVCPAGQRHHLVVPTDVGEVLPNAPRP